MSSTIIRGPWTYHPDPTSLSLSQVRSYMQQHLAEIAPFEQPVHDIATVLASRYKQLPFSYSDQVAATLTSLCKTIKPLITFLEDTSRLPFTISFFSYAFLSPLSHLDGQARTLVSLVENLCLAQSLHPSDLPLLYQRAIRTSEALTTVLTDLPGTITTLLDQAAFHEAQLLAMNQGQSLPAWQA